MNLPLVLTPLPNITLVQGATGINLPILSATDAIVAPIIGQSWAAGRVVGGTWDLVASEQNNPYNKTRIWVKPDGNLIDNGAWEFLGATPENYIQVNPDGTKLTGLLPPALQIASILESLFAEIDIYIVQYAIGGSGLNDPSEWAAGGVMRQLYIEHFLKPALADLEAAGRTIRILPLLTMFGAADGQNSADANLFAERLLLNNDSLISEIRAETNPLLPAAIFRLRNSWAPNIPELNTINAEVDSIAGNSGIFVLDANDVTDGTDDLHLAAKSTRDISSKYVLESTLKGFTLRVDATAPTLQTAVVQNAQPAVIALTYNESLDGTSVPAASDFTVPTKTVTGVAIAGSVVNVTVDAAFTDSDVITISYTPGANPIQDVAGNAAASLSSQAVQNLIAPVSSAVFSDSFVAPDDTDLAAHAPAIGTAWTDSTLKIVGNQAVQGDASGNLGYAAIAQYSAPIPEPIVQAIVDFAALDGIAGVILRYIGLGDALLIQIREAENQIRLFRRATQTTWQEVAVRENITISSGPQIVVVEDSGSEIRAQFGASVVTFNNTEFSTSKRFGLWIRNVPSTTAFNSIEINPLSAFTLTPTP